jgi:phosphoenolpyruvate carboxykinase (ATP)
MLSNKMQQAGVNVWLVNTGWTGGPYGTGRRMKLKYTRAMISAALEGKLNAVDYQTHPIFGLAMPKDCPNVPNEVLNPIDTWESANAYNAKASELSNSFKQNFAQFEEYANEEIMAGGPIS